MGLAQKLLYDGAVSGSSPAGFRDVTSGSNGAYQAGAGWDACTGLGSPHGEELLKRVTG
jgi:kumamolisin